MNLTNHIENIINTAIDNFQTHQTNELALKKISAASVALTRSIQLKNTEADHKILQEQHDFLSQQMEVMLARQTHMNSIITDPINPTLDTTNMPHPSHIPPSVDQAHITRHMQDRDQEHPPHINNHTNNTHISNTQQDSNHLASYQSYRPDSANQRTWYNEPIAQEETSSISLHPRQQYRHEPPNPITYQDNQTHEYSKPQQQEPIQWQPDQPTSPTYDTPKLLLISAGSRFTTISIQIYLHSRPT